MKYTYPESIFQPSIDNEYIAALHDYLRAEWFDCTYYNPKGNKLRDDLAQQIIGDKIERANEMPKVKGIGLFKLIGTIDSHEIIFEWL
jgi:hypothetical protein